MNEKKELTTNEMTWKVKMVRPKREEKAVAAEKTQTAQTTLSTLANTRQRRQWYCCIIYLGKT